MANAKPENKTTVKVSPSQLTERDKLLANMMPQIAANLQGIKTKEKLAETAYEYAKLFLDTVLTNNRK